MQISVQVIGDLAKYLPNAYRSRHKYVYVDVDFDNDTLGTLKEKICEAFPGDQVLPANIVINDMDDLDDNSILTDVEIRADTSNFLVVRQRRNEHGGGYNRIKRKSKKSKSKKRKSKKHVSKKHRSKTRRSKTRKSKTRRRK